MITGITYKNAMQKSLVLANKSDYHLVVLGTCQLGTTRILYKMELEKTYEF